MALGLQHPEILPVLEGDYIQEHLSNWYAFMKHTGARQNI